MKNIYLIEIQT